jgi:plasmid stabilization system protein ParE
MSRYRLQHSARQDLRDIYRYIAHDNSTAAARLLEQFYEHFRFLAANPLAGELRTDLGPTVRLSASVITRSFIVPRASVLPLRTSSMVRAI